MENEEPPDGDGLGYQSVKARLSTIIRQPHTQVRILEVVRAAHHMVVHVWHLLELYLLHSFDLHQPMPLVTVQLLVTMMKVVCDSVNSLAPTKRALPNSYVLMMAFHVEHYLPLMAPGTVMNRKLMDNMLTYLARGMKAKFETNIMMHFAKHAEKFTKLVLV